MTTNAAGEVVARGSDTFGYDGLGRLTSATVGSVAETYAYDGDGNRVTKTSGAVTTPYVLDVNRGLPVILADGTRKYVWGAGLLYAATGSAVEVVHADGLGSVRSLTDAAGLVTATYRTDAWGVPTVSTGSSAQPYGFTGEPVDATGLVDLRARMYDPTTGRFLTRDTWPGSVTVPISLNRCLYAGADPTTYADPSGRCVQFLALAVLGPPGAAAAVGISAGCVAALMIGGGLIGASIYAAVGPKPAPLTPAPGPPFNPPPRQPGEFEPFGTLKGPAAIVAVVVAVAKTAALLLSPENDLGEPLANDVGVKSRVLWESSRRTRNPR